jgi:hypothetical protein
MADKQTTAAAASVPHKKRHRSPAYPAISLAQAIKRAEEFYKHEVRNPASFTAAARHWDYSPTSSGALLTIAALKSFGLFTELEAASGRTVQLSPLGLKIVADKRPESVERNAAIKEAALTPKIHASIWRKYNGSLPSDAELEYRLENDWKFNINSIKPFIKELRDTMSFAKLSESDKVSTGDEDTNGVPPVKIGDYIQWESQGMMQFREPKRVTEFADEGGFLFVEGSNTGIPIDEVTVVEAPVTAPKGVAITPPQREIKRSAGGSANMRQDVFSVDEGEVVLSWPVSLSQDSITDIKEWLKIAERKITRSLKAETPPDSPPPQE